MTGYLFGNTETAPWLGICLLLGTIIVAVLLWAWWHHDAKRCDDPSQIDHLKDWDDK